MEFYRKAAFIHYGANNFSRSAYLKHAAKFDEVDVKKDMTGVNVVVTGANAGIGKSAVKMMAERGATVYALCRNKERGETAVAQIRHETKNENVHLEVVDMSSLAQIKKFAEKYQSSEKPLHVLVNNAGVMNHERTLSEDGLEMNFAVNVAAVVSLTELLLPSLSRAAPDAKVINVATGGILTEPLSADLQLEKESSFDGTVAYARNKRVQLAVTEKWAELYQNQRIGFYSMHPGWVDTAILETAMPGFYKTFKSSLRAPSEGADTILWLASKSNADLTNGAFYFDRTEVPKHLPLGGTKYSSQQADDIFQKIHQLKNLSAPVFST